MAALAGALLSGDRDQELLMRPQQLCKPPRWRGRRSSR